MHSNEWMGLGQVKRGQSQGKGKGKDGRYIENGINEKKLRNAVGFVDCKETRKNGILNTFGVYRGCPLL